MPAGGLGMFLGGYIIKRFDLKMRGILKLCIALNLAITVIALTYIIRCDNVDFAGINVDYSGKSLSGYVKLFTAHIAQFRCDCIPIEFRFFKIPIQSLYPTVHVQFHQFTCTCALHNTPTLYRTYYLFQRGL